MQENTPRRLIFEDRVKCFNFRAKSSCVLQISCMRINIPRKIQDYYTRQTFTMPNDKNMSGKEIVSLIAVFALC